MNVSNTPRAVLLTAIFLYCVVVFALDVILPIGVEVWVLNVPVILISVFFRSERLVVIACLVCSVMVVIGSADSTPGNNPRMWDVFNRGMGLAAMWLITGVTLNTIRKANQLNASLDRLRDEIARHDRTSRVMEQSEERLRLAVEGAGMGTYDVNLRRGTVVCSPTHLRLLGFETADSEYPIEMWRAWVHPDDRERVQEERDRAIQGRSLYATEYRIIRANDGTVAWLAVFGRCYYSGTGEGVRFVGVSFEISQQKELEHKMHQKELESEVLDITEREQRRIGQELHDSVGQELTGLGLIARTLFECLSATGSEQRIAERLVAGLTRLHQQIRDLARGLLPVEIESEGLWAALDDLAARTSEQSGVAVTFECPNRVELPDHTTSIELYRIAQEAVSNALRHGRPEAVRMRILSQPDDLQLRIKDDGIGIPDRPKRVKGLGMRIMEYRAGSINGVFSIEPAEDGGTVVTVTIPRRIADEQHERGHAGANKDPCCG